MLPALNNDRTAAAEVRAAQEMRVALLSDLKPGCGRMSCVH